MRVIKDTGLVWDKGFVIVNYIASSCHRYFLKSNRNVILTTDSGKIEIIEFLHDFMTFCVWVLQIFFTKRVHVMVGIGAKVSVFTALSLV